MSSSDEKLAALYERASDSSPPDLDAGIRAAAREAIANEQNPAVWGWQQRYGWASAAAILLTTAIFLELPEEGTQQSEFAPSSVAQPANSAEPMPQVNSPQETDVATTEVRVSSSTASPRLSPNPNAAPTLASDPATTNGAPLSIPFSPPSSPSSSPSSSASISAPSSPPPAPPASLALDAEQELAVQSVSDAGAQALVRTKEASNRNSIEMQAATPPQKQRFEGRHAITSGSAKALKREQGTGCKNYSHTTISHACKQPDNTWVLHARSTSACGNQTIELSRSNYPLAAAPKQLDLADAYAKEEAQPLGEASAKSNFVFATDDAQQWRLECSNDKLRLIQFKQ